MIACAASVQQICSDVREGPAMNRTTKLIAGGVGAVTLIGGGTAIAVASVGGDDEPLTGTTLDQAVAAALEETGGGTVTESEVGDDGAAYSVEVQFDDGSQVEVNPDENFNVIGQAADDDGANDQDGGDDDADSLWKIAQSRGSSGDSLTMVGEC